MLPQLCLLLPRKHLGPDPGILLDDVVSTFLLDDARLLTALPELLLLTNSGIADLVLLPDLFLLSLSALFKLKLLFPLCLAKLILPLLAPRPQVDLLLLADLRLTDLFPLPPNLFLLRLLLLQDLLALAPDLLLLGLLLLTDLLHLLLALLLPLFLDRLPLLLSLFLDRLPLLLAGLLLFLIVRLIIGTVASAIPLSTHFAA